MVKSKSWKKALKDNGWADTHLAGDTLKEQLKKDVTAKVTIPKDIAL